MLVTLLKVSYKGINCQNICLGPLGNHNGGANEHFQHSSIHTILIGMLTMIGMILIMKVVCLSHALMEHTMLQNA